MKTFVQYRKAVLAALAPFGKTETEQQSVDGYKEYLACVEILGDGEIVAEPDETGEVRVYVKAGAITASAA